MWQPTHRHYKGRVYQFLGYGSHTETGECLAVYRSEAGTLWVRPRAMFDDPARFQPLDTQPAPAPAGERFREGDKRDRFPPEHAAGWYDYEPGENNRLSEEGEE